MLKKKVKKRSKKRLHFNDGGPREIPRATPPRPSKLDSITISACQEVTHLSTSDIVRRRTVLQCETTALESEQNELQARMILIKERIAKSWAILAGLNQAIGKRMVC